MTSRLCSFVGGPLDGEQQECSDEDSMVIVINSQPLITTEELEARGVRIHGYVRDHLRFVHQSLLSGYSPEEADDTSLL